MTLSIYEIVAYSWAGVNIGIVLGFFMGVIFFVMIYKNFMENTENMSATLRLKNALLSYALLKVKKDDFVGLDSGVSSFNTPIINYKSYEGDKLPRLSGFSIVNSLMNYIVKPYKSFFYYTNHMNDKYNAIEKYLQKHFETDKKVIDFFTTFVDEVESKTKVFVGEVESKDVGTSTANYGVDIGLENVGDDTKSDADESTTSIVDEYRSDMDESTGK